LSRYYYRFLSDETKEYFEKQPAHRIVSQSKSMPNLKQDAAVVSNVAERKISAQELAKHSHGQDCWIAIKGVVYDISKFMNAHPGGSQTLIPYLGADGTHAFQDVGVCSWLSYAVIPSLSHHLACRTFQDSHFQHHWSQSYC
jgi:cytochrome b involved in lipid metabolism